MSKKEAKKVLVVYMPVYHRGHRDLFAKFEQIDTLYLVNGENLQGLFPTKKDIYGLGVTEIKAIIEKLDRFKQIRIISPENWGEIEEAEIVASDDEVADWLVQNGIKREKITVSPVFLRWTRKKVLAEQEVEPEREMTSDDPEVVELMARAGRVGERSGDWWRQVGAVLRLASGEILTAYNQHLPENQTPYIRGDIRGQFHRGEHWELGTAIHAEAAVIGLAARAGQTTQGAEIWVTDFPCPNCAKLIVAAGIKRVCYQKGYAVADGREVLAAGEVEVVRVKYPLGGCAPVVR